MLTADQPILSPEQDLLGRNNFVKALVRAALASNETNCLTIALDGHFGSGKSSLLNLIDKELLVATKYTLDDEKPIHAHYNAWLYSDTDQLIVGLVSKLIDTIRNTTYLETKQELEILLTEYLQFFSKQMKIEKTPVFCRKKNKQPLTIEECKEKITYLLKIHKHKIIITVDNISRLNLDATLQFFKIINCLVDFQNTIYILAFDKDIVLEKFKIAQIPHGQNYLDKIIQISFPVPPVSQQMLTNILFSKLKTILTQMNEKEWDQQDWNKLYDSNFYLLLRDMRDINRYLNMLGFTYNWLEVEVNHVDFFIITGLRALEPKIYGAIRENKTLFTTPVQDTYSDRDLHVQQEKKHCDTILSLSEILPENEMRQLLTLLFPKLALIYDNKCFTDEDIQRWQKKHRICDANDFDRYFVLDLPIDYLTKETANLIVQNLKHEQEFADSIKSMAQEKRALSIFELYEDYIIKNAQEQDIPTAIKVMLDCSDMLPEFKKTFANFDIDQHTHRICQQLLVRLPNSDKRFAALATAFKYITNSLYVPIYELSQQEKQNLLTKIQIAKLQKILMAEIEAWGKENRLITHPHLPEILVFWKEWGHKNRNDKFIMQLIKTDENLVTFIYQFLREPVTKFMNNLTRSPEWQQYRDKVGQFIALTKIEPRIGKLFENGTHFQLLPEHHQVAILIFLDRT